MAHSPAQLNVLCTRTTSAQTMVWIDKKKKQENS